MQEDLECEVITRTSHHSASRPIVQHIRLCPSLSFSILPDCERLQKWTAYACFWHAWWAAPALWGPPGMTPLPVVSVLPGCSSPLGENTCCASSLLLFDTAVCVLPPSHVLTRARDKYVNWAWDHTVQRNVMACVFPCARLYVRNKCKCRTFEIVIYYRSLGGGVVQHLLINCDTSWRGGRTYSRKGFCACNEILKCNPSDTKYHNSQCRRQRMLRVSSEWRPCHRWDCGRGISFYHFLISPPWPVMY